MSNFQMSNVRILANLLVVVKMMLDALDDLVVFVSFSGNEDDIVLLRQRAGSLDSGCAVLDDERAAQFLRRQSVRHVLEDILRFFVTRVIRGQD